MSNSFTESHGPVVYVFIILIALFYDWVFVVATNDKDYQ